MFDLVLLLPCKIQSTCEAEEAVVVAQAKAEARKRLMRRIQVAAEAEAAVQL